MHLSLSPALVLLAAGGLLAAGVPSDASDLHRLKAAVSSSSYNSEPNWRGKRLPDSYKLMQVEPYLERRRPTQYDDMYQTEIIYNTLRKMYDLKPKRINEERDREAEQRKKTAREYYDNWVMYNLG